MRQLAVPNRVGVLCGCECGRLTNEKNGKISKFVKGHGARRFKIGELRDPKVADAFHCLKRKYGLSYDGYYELLNAQNGVCAICRSDDPGNTRGGRGSRFAVDHSHETGKIRGLLCHNCNKGLGNLRDSSKLVERAIEYLKGHVVR